MEEYGIIFTISVVASFVHCLIGFGDALLMIPFLLIFFDLPAANIITNNYAIIIGIFLTKYNFKNLKKHYLELFLLFFSYTIMTIYGAKILSRINTKILVIMLSFVLLVYPLLIFLIEKYRIFNLNRFFSLIFGGLAGFLGVTTTINGPPLVLYGQLRKFNKDVFIAILQPIFLWGAIINFYHYHQIGWVDLKFTIIGLSTIPIIIFNFYICKRIRDKLNESIFRFIVMVMIFTSGLIMLIKNLISS